ncbi:enoyl-CoA hydratase-related protein [Deinococcus enclensis]|uniref:Enoyl-CoA hydratase n=1 Tax=Deinococcus enclensis TaxID=1049582 RepID=A0ABT9MGS0_9DEIO|nr:enoyl-CoA hydratase-related protein [Deinococcus enclensis]MDP9765788.1 enoyl-CoA hydratase [Deinococcus enclensis]
MTTRASGAAPVRLTRQGPVATLTLTPPKGALGPDFWPAVPAALAGLGDARVLIVRGEHLFSVGLDVKATAPQLAPLIGSEAGFLNAVQAMHGAIEALAALPVPVIAAVHGWCIGAGLELISACDLRLCSADARFSLPEVKLGITADLGGLQRLPRLIGLGRAAHLALTAEPIDAPTAERWGLVTEVLDTPAALFARADALAGQLAALPAAALEGTKRSLHDPAPHHEAMLGAVRWNARHMSVQALAAALKK